MFFAPLEPGLRPPRPHSEGVTAVVCNFNGEAYLEDCLRAVLAQGADEVIVVDDASTDGSLALVRERFPSVEVLALGENRGPCAARNAGMRAARHRWVLAIDNDAVLADGVLERLRSAIESHPGVVVAQTRSVLFDDETRVHYDSGDAHYVGLIALRNFYTPLAEARGTGVVETGAMVAICALVDRDVLLSLGGYDEALFYLAEDLDLALRLRLAGHRLVVVEDALVRHRGGTEGLSFRGGVYPRRRVFLAARNRPWILLKTCRWSTLVLIAPALVLYDVVALAFALQKGALGAHLSGRVQLVRRLGPILRSRSAVQAQRRIGDRRLFVGGPLVLSPALESSRIGRGLAAGLDRMLRAWWALVRPMIR